MKPPFRHFGAAASGLLLAASFSPAPARAQSAPFPSNGGLAAHMQPLVDDRVIAGAVMLVADKDKVLDCETVGYADAGNKKPMEANDLFWIASMTKSFTCTAFMMLVDEGKVRVDDPVSLYIPEFKDAVVAEKGMPGATHPVRHPVLIRNLLTHTSGVAEPHLPNRSLYEDIAILAKTPFRFEPGTQYEYSSLGMDAIARVIEVVSGMPYADFIQKRLLDPLGLKDTTFWPNEEQASRLAKAYRWKKGAQPGEHTLEVVDKNQDLIADPSRRGGVPVPILAGFNNMPRIYASRYASGGGGLFSTAPDIATFCQMMLNHGTFRGRMYLSAGSIREMATLRTGDIPVELRHGFGGEGYGYGFSVFRADGAYNTGGFGHLGAMRTMMWIDPPHGLVYVLMVQSGEPPIPEQRRMYGAIIQPAIKEYWHPRDVWEVREALHPAR